MSELDLLFCARNRIEFTVESLQSLLDHTNWSKVSKLWIYDDGSADGTKEFLEGYVEVLRQCPQFRCELRTTKLGSPIAVMNDFIWRSKSPLLAKIDNDTILPPRWLDTALDILAKQPEVDCLGLEHRGLDGELPYHATATDHIGGLYVAHRRAFEHGGLPVPNNKYFGWQEYQKRHGLRVCWIAPSMKVFLLDRVPEEPWVSLSRKYEAAGWQRRVAAWDYRREDAGLWKWWTERDAESKEAA